MTGLPFTMEVNWKWTYTLNVKVKELEEKKNGLTLKGQQNSQMLWVFSTRQERFASDGSILSYDIGIWNPMGSIWGDPVSEHGLLLYRVCETFCLRAAAGHRCPTSAGQARLIWQYLILSRSDICSSSDTFSTEHMAHRGRRGRVVCNKPGETPLDVH